MSVFLDCDQQNISKKKLLFLYTKKPGKSKGYAFLNVSNHVYQEIVKFNGVEFKSQPFQKKLKQNMKIVHQIKRTCQIINSKIIT